MTTLRSWKTRFPKAYAAMTLVLGVAAVGGVAAYENHAQESCCYPGAPCCHPGAACCAGHRHAAR